jgi:hypothetical protein
MGENCHIEIDGLKKLSNSPLLRGELFECREMAN